jgi:hypothetical protein
MFPVINAIRDDDERAEIVRKPNLQKTLDHVPASKIGTV